MLRQKNNKQVRPSFKTVSDITSKKRFITFW